MDAKTQTEMHAERLTETAESVSKQRLIYDTAYVAERLLPGYDTRDETAWQYLQRIRKIKPPPPRA